MRHRTTLAAVLVFGGVAQALGQGQGAAASAPATPVAAATPVTGAAPALPDRARVLAAARDVIRAARYCTLVTLDGKGEPQVRVMDPAEPDPGFDIWFGTNARTRKVEQLRGDARAALNYFDRATGAYVTLLGTVTVVADEKAKAERWAPKWAPFYPQGAKSPELVLLRFTPRRLEIFSAPHKLENDAVTWRPVSLEFAPPAR